GSGMREVLRAELKSAMRARDRVAVAALRSAIATIDNAEAVPAETPLPEANVAASEDAQQHVAGAVVGVGNSEVTRRELGEARMRELVTAGITEREEHADDYDRLGRADSAEQLRAEAAVLRGVLDGAGGQDGSVNQDRAGGQGGAVSQDRAGGRSRRDASAEAPPRLPRIASVWLWSRNRRNAAPPTRSRGHVPRAPAASTSAGRPCASRPARVPALACPPRAGPPGCRPSCARPVPALPGAGPRT